MDDVLHLLATIVGGSIVAFILAGLAWFVLRWTAFQGVGPVIVFAVLATNLPSTEFTQMLLLFSGLYALVGFVSLFLGGRYPDEAHEMAGESDEHPLSSEHATNRSRIS